MTDIPIVMGPEGRIPTPPADLRAQLVALATTYDPDLTANLPGTLIEDIASTDTGALVLCDQAVSDIINSLTPYGANEFVLRAQAAVAGVNPQETTNTSVFVVFHAPGSPGFVIAKGFTVSDGVHQYVVQDGGIIGSGGDSLPLYCLATVSGTWAVSANTVTQLASSVPDSVVLTCNNPQPGTPSAGAQTVAQLQAQVLQAYGRSAAQGMPTLLRTLLENVTGVQQRLIAIQQQMGGGWKVIVGGGDPYQVAYAIFIALFDVSILVGSTDPTRNITVTINDFPDSILVIYVNPPAQAVTMTLTWNTNSPNYISDAAVSDAGQPALAAYINGIQAGSPINIFQMQEVFQAAIIDIIPPEFLTRMVFAVSIDTVLTPPTSGTGIIPGDPEGYFTCDASDVNISRG